MIWQKIAKIRAAKKEAMAKKKTVINEKPTNDADYVLKHFKLSEFDSPDVKGSGQNMQKSTLRMLDEARELAGVPFHINSGFRTEARNEAKGGAKHSAHTKGYAADIACTAATRDKILKSLYQVGFRRFGIGATYIHADNDMSLPPNTVWGYPCKSNSCAPDKYKTTDKIAAL